MMGRYATYFDLADLIRKRFEQPSRLEICRDACRPGGRSLAQRRDQAGSRIPSAGTLRAVLPRAHELIAV